MKKKKPGFGLNSYHQLKIRNQHYDVFIVDKMPMDEKDDRKTMGICDSAEDTIYIRSKLTPKQLLETYVHEIIHALDDAYDIKLKHKQVYMLDKAIARFIKDNY